MVPGWMWGQELDLERYISLLREKNPVLRQGANQVLSSSRDVQAAQAALLPSVAIASSYQRDFTKNFLFVNDPDFGQSRFRTNFNNSINVDLVAEQALYNPMASAQVRIAKLAHSLSDLSLEATAQELVVQGSQLFWQALYLKESLAILEENRNLAHDQWMQMKNLLEQGMVSELEVQQTELFYKRTLPELASAQNAHASTLNEMKVLAGLDPAEELRLSGTITLPDSTASLSDEVALNQNVRLRAAIKEFDIANEQIKASKSARLPVITASLGYNLNSQDDDFKFENDNQLWYGRVAIQIPLFTGGLNNAGIARSKIGLENARIEADQVRLGLMKDLRNARLRRSLALEHIQSEEEAIVLSGKELEIAQERTKLGLLTPLENKEIRLNLTRAKLNLINARLDLRLATSEINKILGNR